MARARQKSIVRRAASDSNKIERELQGTVAACRRNYASNANVIGVGAGLKFKAGRAANKQLCIHFYVRKKLRRVSARARLPKFVYARRRNGSVDPSRRFCTDVIELRQLQPACKAGSQVDVIGESGTMTLVFRNKVTGDPRFYIVTCAHVAGDVQNNVPVDPRMASSCCQHHPVFAETLVNSTQSGGVVDYDIALGRITTQCSPQPDLQVVGSSRRLRSFLSASDIRPGLTLECAFPVSSVSSAHVSSLRTSLPIVIDHREYLVNNLFLIDRTPRRGDSGGLLYDGSDAAGILVAMSDGWGLLQPLEEAFAHLKQISPAPIECF